MTKSDGTRVTVYVDKDFKVVSTENGPSGPPTSGHPANPPTTARPGLRAGRPRGGNDDSGAPDAG